MGRFILATAALLPCFAQPPLATDTGVIAGTVSGEDGSPVAGADVTLHLSFSPRQGARQAFQTQWGVSSGSDGSFRFSGLRAGTYRLCAQASASAWLDPCEWGLPVPSVELAAQSLRTIAIRLKKGAEVTIRIEDPAQVLLQHEGRTAGAHLMAGVRTAAFSFLPAAPVSREAAGKTLRVVVPFDKNVRLTIASAFFTLADGYGTPFPRPGIAIPLTVPAGQKAPTVVLRVTGRR